MRFERVVVYLSIVLRYTRTRETSDCEKIFLFEHILAKYLIRAERLANTSYEEKTRRRRKTPK